MEDYESAVWQARQDLEREIRLENDYREAWERQKEKVAEARRVLDSVQETRFEALFQIMKRVDQRLEEFVSGRSDRNGGEIQDVDDHRGMDTHEAYRGRDSDHEEEDEEEGFRPIEQTTPVRAVRSAPRESAKRHQMQPDEASATGNNDANEVIARDFDPSDSEDGGNELKFKDEDIPDADKTDEPVADDTESQSAVPSASD